MTSFEQVLMDDMQDALIVDDVLVIDAASRTVLVPGTELIMGVEEDERGERKLFRMPKVVGNDIDVTACNLHINYRNANGEVDYSAINEVHTDGDYLTFVWELPRKFTKYKGNVQFIVCVCKSVGDVIQNEWHTTLATGKVLEGLVALDHSDEESTLDIIARLEGIAKQAANSAASAQHAATIAMNSATKAEEAANRTNPEVLFVEYGQVTYLDMMIAFDKQGYKTAVCKVKLGDGMLQPVLYLPLLQRNSPYKQAFEFASVLVDIDRVMVKAVLDVYDNWTFEHYGFEMLEQYRDVFNATYGMATWDELVEAYDHKSIVVWRELGDRALSVYHHYKTDFNNEYMEFRQPGKDGNTPYCRCTKDGDGEVWSYGEYTTTPESINAQPGYIEDITSGDLNDYTVPGNYRIRSTANASIANAPFAGEVGTFLRVSLFNDNKDNPRIVQEAFTNKIGGVDSKWRTKSLDEENWSQWQDDCNVHIMTYDETLSETADPSKSNEAKAQKVWDVLEFKFGKFDDGKLKGDKTVFCRYQMYDEDKDQYEYYMLPLSKITPNYISFRGMITDTKLATVRFYNPGGDATDPWGWSYAEKSMASSSSVTTLKNQISALEKRIAALEG